MVSLSGKKYFRNALDASPPDPKLDDGQRNTAGEVLSAENFPAEIWGIEGLHQDRPLPSIFMGYGPWIVSRAAANVMSQFDLGRAQFFPIRVLKKDRRTPMPGDWLCLNFGNVKRAYRGGGRDPSPGIKGKTHLWHGTPQLLADNQLLVSADALTGPHIWVDPQIYDTFFVNGRMAAALKAAGMGRAFGFKKCKLVGD